MKARVLSLLTAGAVMTGLLTGCSGGTKNVEASGEAGKGYQKIELVMAVNGTDIQIDSRVADKFAELVEEASDGNVTIAVYPNDQLAGGNSTKGIEMIAGGGVDLAAYAHVLWQSLTNSFPWQRSRGSLMITSMPERSLTTPEGNTTRSGWRQRESPIWLFPQRFPPDHQQQA